MKITKRQLRRIIKEEKAKLLNEVTPSEREEALRLSAEDAARPGDTQSETQYEDPEFLELVEAFRDLIQDANRQGLNEQDIEDAFNAALDEAGASPANRG